MSTRKRYKDSVNVTVRMPEGLRNRAEKLVRKIQGERLEVPGTKAIVKPSIAVLALRGLERELEEIKERLDRRLEARRVVKEKGLKPIGSGDGSRLAPPKASS